MALYTAIATTVGGRNGHTETNDGVIKFDLTLPPSLGGGAKPGATNPEQLFACGYSACFGQALDVTARKHRLAPEQVRVTAEVSLDKSPEGGFMLATVLRVGLPGLSREDGEKVMHEAHQICPYSNATRGNMPVELILE